MKVDVLTQRQVQTSCGFGVPLLRMREDPSDPEKSKPYLQDRETMGHWASKKMEKGELEEYQRDWNYDSLDGLTGMRAARRQRGERMWIGDARTWIRRNQSVVDRVFVAVFSSLLTVMLLWFWGLVKMDFSKLS